MTPIAPSTGRAPDGPSVRPRPAARPSGARFAGRARSHRGETALCVALSAALHLGAIAAFAMVAPSGAPSGGSSGVMLVTLVSAEPVLPAVDPPDPTDVPDPAPRSELAAAADGAVPAAPPAPPPASALAAATPSALPDPAPPSPPAEAPAPARSAAPAQADPPRPRPAQPTPARAEPEAPPVPARQAGRAQGVGGGAEAGPRASAPAATGSAQADGDAMQRWSARIQRALQRRLVPPAALEGATRDLRVVIALSVAPSGQLRAASVARSSGDPTLDAAALRAVRRLGRLPAAPDGLTAAAYPFTAPIELRSR